MEQTNLYGSCGDTMRRVMASVMKRIEEYSNKYEKEQGEKLYEHLSGRIKSEESMLAKIRRLGLEENTQNALRSVTDSIGIRVVCLFMSDRSGVFPAAGL